MSISSNSSIQSLSHIARSSETVLTSQAGNNRDERTVSQSSLSTAAVVSQVVQTALIETATTSTASSSIFKKFSLRRNSSMRSTAVGAVGGEEEGAVSSIQEGNGSKKIWKLRKSLLFKGLGKRRGEKDTNSKMIVQTSEGGLHREHLTVEGDYEDFPPPPSPPSNTRTLYKNEYGDAVEWSSWLQGWMQGFNEMASAKQQAEINERDKILTQQAQALSDMVDLMSCSSSKHYVEGENAATHMALLQTSLSSRELEVVAARQQLLEEIGNGSELQVLMREIEEESSAVEVSDVLQSLSLSGPEAEGEGLIPQVSLLPGGGGVDLFSLPESIGAGRFLVEMLTGNQRSSLSLVSTSKNPLTREDGRAAASSTVSAVAVRAEDAGSSHKGPAESAPLGASGGEEVKAEEGRDSTETAGAVGGQKEELVVRRKTTFGLGAGAPKKKGSKKKQKEAPLTN